MMPATAIEKVPPAEYLEAERKSDTKHEYILVPQDKPLIEVFSRHQDAWHLTEASGLEGKIKLQTLSFDLSLAAVYTKAKFDK